MKRLFASLLAATLLFTAAGCDFLNKEPLGQLSSKNFFETQRDAIQATNATYNMLRDWNVHAFSWLGMTSIVSDNATKGSTPSDASFLLELDRLNWNAGNTAFGSVWEGYYQGIYRANVAIQNIPEIQMDDRLQTRLIGENKFLRAYFYFFLVRAFGGVPKITEPLNPGEFEQPRASREEIYSLIEQDLKDAIEALPEQDEYLPNDLGRATKGAARGLLAKVHLFQEEYQQAQQYAEDVIESGVYSLEPDYNFVFRQEGEFSSGSVFEVQSAALEAGGAASQYGQVQGVRGIPNLGWGFNQPSHDLEISYEPGDPRQQATILYPWELWPNGTGVAVHINPDMLNHKYSQKAQPPVDAPGGSGNSPVNIHRLRYADVLLIAAEAAYRMGNEGKARRYLNRVRRRARDNQTATLGILPERLGEQIATENLGLGPNTSRVFVRYVDKEGPAQGELQSFSSSYWDDSGEMLPVVVDTIDIIQSVDGEPVTEPSEFEAFMRSVSPGEVVTVEGVRLTQQEQGGEVTTESRPFVVNIEAIELLPDVTASGRELLEAIWHERRAELAMEQHRWFSIIRQGRAEELMDDVGENFQPYMRNYPIPQSEIDLTGIDQNEDY